MKNQARILILGDILREARHIKKRLEAEGFGVRALKNGPRTMERCIDKKYALVILGTALPGLAGLDLCRQMRAFDQEIPIIMLSAPGNEWHCIRAYEAGCDDYVVRPINVDELAARVKAVLRRCERAKRTGAGTAQERVIRVGSLKIDPDKRLVSRDNKQVYLTAKEFDLLCLLASNPGRVYSRRELLDLLWDYDAEVYESTVNSHMNRLRGKIEKNPRSPKCILTVWGIGYRFRRV